MCKILLSINPEHVENIFNGNKKYENESGINLEFFKKYYKGRKKAIAYQLTSIIKYEHPKTLKDYGLKMAPQSFIYVK